MSSHSLSICIRRLHATNLGVVRHLNELVVSHHTYPTVSMTLPSVTSANGIPQASASFPVAAGIADQQGRGQVDIPFLLRFAHHAGLRLAAIAGTFFMRAIEDVSRLAPWAAMRCACDYGCPVDPLPCKASGDAALIGDHNRQESGGLNKRIHDTASGSNRNSSQLRMYSPMGGAA